VWGSAEKLPTKADELSSYWYVQSHTETEIIFKFDFDNPDQVSSGSYGSDEVTVLIKDLDKFES
jgi:hypothetical protein